jgi:hypothetical protein
MADDDAERELPPHVLALRIAQREIELLRFIRTALRKQGLNDFSYPDIYRRNDNINAAV